MYHEKAQLFYINRVPRIVNIMRRETMNTQEKSDKRVPCEVYSRIVGYLRPVQNWHVGKRQEYRERTKFVFPAPADLQSGDLQQTDSAPLESSVAVEAK
jgi:hypothetical protein